MKKDDSDIVFSVGAVVGLAPQPYGRRRFCAFFRR